MNILVISEYIRQAEKPKRRTDFHTVQASGADRR
mgnify:CR=1 FL=1